MTYSLVLGASNARSCVDAVRRAWDAPRRFAPHFERSSSPLWAGLVDGMAQYPNGALLRLVARADLAFASVWLDDNPDFDELTGEYDKFPWDDWRLVEAFVVEPGRPTRVRAGPALQPWSQ